MFAASNGHPEVLEMLLSHNASLTATDSFGRTVLHHCCRSGNLANVRLLLDRITDTSLYEARSNGGVTPLMSAIQSGNPYIVGHCLNKSFNPFQRDYMGKTCRDYARPFSQVGGGHKVETLITTAMEQWLT